MESPTCVDSAALFNSQPHINDIEDGLDATDEHQSNIYTFMLRHKHFDLAPGEVLFIEKKETGFDVNVRTRESMEESSPCMWLYSSGWKPFAYTKSEFGYDKSCDMPEGDYNLGVRWLNEGGTERTDDVNRIQYVRPDCKNSLKGEVITTCVNWEASAGHCVKTHCEKEAGTHIKLHTGV